LKITVREIAELTGVSPATVSLVLNNKEGVSEETRKRVKAAIKAHNYTPPLRQKKDAGGSIRLIKYAAHGMVVEENQGFITSIIDQVEAECFRNHYTVVMTGCNSSTAEATFQLAAADPLDGVILIGSEFNQTVTQLMRQIKAPMVVIDNPMHYEPVDSVVMANEEIAYGAVRYLKQLGHETVGYFKSSVRIANFERREVGYLSALKDLSVKPGSTVSLTPTLKGAYEDMQRMLQKRHPALASAYFADNDTIALGAMKALQEAGYSIPGDLSIVGVDDIPFSAINTPPLTTMRVSRSTIGKMAVDLLLKRIRNQYAPFVHMQITGQLIVRDSTCPKLPTTH